MDDRGVKYTKKEKKASLVGLLSQSLVEEEVATPSSFTVHGPPLSLFNIASNSLAHHSKLSLIPHENIRASATDIATIDDDDYGLKQLLIHLACLRADVGFLTRLLDDGVSPDLKAFYDDDDGSFETPLSIVLKDANYSSGGGGDASNPLVKAYFDKRESNDASKT